MLLSGNVSYFSNTSQSKVVFTARQERCRDVMTSRFMYATLELACKRTIKAYEGKTADETSRRVQ